MRPLEFMPTRWDDCGHDRLPVCSVLATRGSNEFVRRPQRRCRQLAESARQTHGTEAYASYPLLFYSAPHGAAVAGVASGGHADHVGLEVAHRADGSGDLLSHGLTIESRRLDERARSHEVSSVDQIQGLRRPFGEPVGQ